MRLVLCVVAATPAFADVVETREDAIAGTAELVPITADQIGWRYRLDAAAAGVLRSEGNERQDGVIGTATADVALTTSGSDCDLFMLGGMLTGRTDERLVSASFHGTFCPVGGDGHIEFDHRLDWDVTPRLLTAPILRPGPSRRAMQGVNFLGAWRPYNADEDPKAPTTVEWVQGGRARFEASVGWTKPSGVIEDVHTYLDATMRTYRRDYGDDKPFTFDILYIRGEALATVAPEEPHILVGGVRGDAVRIEGFRAGPLRLGGRLGGRLGAISRVGEGDPKMRFTNLGEGGASAELGPVRLAFERASTPLWDGRLLVDNRVTLGQRVTLGRLRGSAELAAAYTQLFSTDVYRKGVTSGATVEVEFDLTDFLSLRARSEVGRSFYAQQMIVDEPVWASETLLLLSAHAHRGIKR